MKNSTILAIFGSLTIGSILYTVFAVSSYYSDRSKTNKELREACVNLDISFGDRVGPKTGFLKGVDMTAVNIDEFFVYVRYPTGETIEKGAFFCKDLEKR